MFKREVIGCWFLLLQWGEGGSVCWERAQAREVQDDVFPEPRDLHSQKGDAPTMYVLMKSYQRLYHVRT